MEDLMNAFIIKTDERLETHSSAIREHGATIKEMDITFRNLVRQVGQLATLLSERVPGTLLADIERNPKETINAVSLRSGHKLEDPIAKQKDELIERQVEIVGQQKNNNIQEGEVMVDEDLKKKGRIRAQKKKKNDNSTNNETGERKYMPALPSLRSKEERKVLSQMPAYVKFMKEILSKKRKVEETLVVKPTEHYSAILQNKLPKKCGDPGSASINLILLSIFRKLEGEIGEIRSIPVSLQLADQTTIIPEGIVEDVLVQVEKFVFPVDFIVVNMEENREVSLILGRPFLAMGRAILDIEKRQLMLRVGDESLSSKWKEKGGP
ncbi:PREDICTED: uncharacterized protein LOC109208759 [Nicotiana attenuata]|uniref:uncharacterized protein LOC109208759 n=1 Tax=Nicotiana attenuata TaxID=49451 RepID=UPI000904D69E|nr:PREDICTED: uncharacterized protein LOC109208759 [Nicotiana attenuata]